MTPSPRPPRRAAWSRLVLLASLLAVATTVAAPPAPPRPPVQGEVIAPAWELKNVDGKTVRLADFRGRLVILDFWATWCPPCVESIPGFVELQKKYGDRGLTVIGVSLDQGDPARVKSFMARTKINYPIVMGSPEIAQAYGGMEAIPTFFVIDREGRVLGMHTGYLDKAILERAIQKLL